MPKPLTETELEYERESARLESELRSSLTSEFLNTLVRAAQTYGYSGDWVETASFVDWCFDIAGVNHRTLKPFQNP